MNQQQLHEEMLRQMLASQQAAQRMAQQAQVTQHLLDTDHTYGRIRKFTIIAAVDNQGGFAANGKIPWNYPEDLRWFKNRTNDGICVMGRKTYQDIITRLGGEINSSVLPGRRCFVLSTSLVESSKAILIKDINDIDKHLELSDTRPVFVIGGERLFREMIALVDIVYLTIINQDYQCDQFFPTKYLQQYFTVAQLLKTEENDKLRFTVWKRKDLGQVIIPTIDIQDAEIVI